MTTKDIPALLKRNLMGVRIAGFEPQDGKLIIWRETAAKNVAVHIDRIVGSIKELNWLSSHDTKTVDVSRWVNSDEHKAPNSTMVDPNPPEPVVTDPLKFLGRNIIGVGVYEKVVGRNRHYTVSLRTIIGEVETKKTKVETLVMGLVTAK